MTRVSDRPKSPVIGYPVAMPAPRPQLTRSKSSFARAVAALAPDADLAVARQPMVLTPRACQQPCAPGTRPPDNTPVGSLPLRQEQNAAGPAADDAKRSLWQRFQIATNRWLCGND